MKHRRFTPPAKGKAAIRPRTTISPFWYRRICEVTLLVSLVLVGVFGLGLVVFKSTVLVPVPIALFAVVTAALSGASYIWISEKFMYRVSFALYGLMVATVGLLIVTTGSATSPYVSLWMLLSLFSGLFGLWGLLTVFIPANSLLAYSALASHGLNGEQLLVFFLAVEVPVVVSYLIWHDVTGHNRSHAFDALAKQLSEVANKSEIVINSIADGVMAIDAEGAIQLINPAAQELLGWGKEDAMQLDYRSVLKLTDAKGKDLGNEASPIQQVLFSGMRILTNDLALVTHSGKKILISLAVSPLGDTSPAAGAIAVFRDITNLKEEERQKAEFISTASHEMRTPVASIEGYLALALNPATATIDDKAKMYLEKAHEATKHLGDLFQDLLTISRAEDNRLNTKPTVIDVVAFMREITEGLIAKAKAKEIFLYFKPGGGQTSTGEGGSKIAPVLYTLADSGQLREVAGNLVENAIKYTKKGSVTIDVTADAEHVTFSIKDTGIGIPPEDLPHLFQKFYRIDNTDTREIGGTGLGLYIARRLVEANNGRISVESEYGKGSTFFVQLPRISHERATELIEGQAEPQNAPLASLK